MGRPLSHYCGKTRDGRFLLYRKTQRKRMIRKLKVLRREMWRRMHQRFETSTLGSRCRAGTTPTSASRATARLSAFRLQVMKAWRRVLLRRSQRPKLSWARLQRSPQGLLATCSDAYTAGVNRWHDQETQKRSRMRESRMSGSIRGASSDRRLYSTLLHSEGAGQCRPAWRSQSRLVALDIGRASRRWRL
jgi:hypothetical protein